jgi:collagenase-like PrtC family protease
MEIVLASNFDDALVERTRSMPVSTFFGGFPVQLTGGGRPPQILPKVSPERFREHVAAIHRQGREFYATLNSNDLGLREYRPGYVEEFRREVGRMLDLGVDGFVVALPFLIEAIRDAWPDVPVSVSTFARIRTATQAEYFLKLGGRTIILEEANRDFRLIRALVRMGAEVEILVNQSCLPSCPYRGHHLNTSSLASQPGAAGPSFEYPILECGLEYVRDPSKLISGIFVRPEDLEVYEEYGVSRFKISGRNRTTDWLVGVAEAYSARHFTGNLADILSLVQVKGPRAALRHAAHATGNASADALADAFEPLREISIDNQAFPKDFLRHIAAVDCERTTCSACGYCRRVAEQVLRIAGRPPSEYRPPTGLRSPVPMVSCFGVPDAPGGPRSLRPTVPAALPSSP